MANISREEEQEDLKIRKANNGNRPHGKIFVSQEEINKRRIAENETELKSLKRQRLALLLKKPKKKTVVAVDGVKDELYTMFYKCKSCKYSNITDNSKYCGGCGFKIREKILYK